MSAPSKKNGLQREQVLYFCQAAEAALRILRDQAIRDQEAGENTAAITRSHATVRRLLDQLSRAPSIAWLCERLDADQANQVAVLGIHELALLDRRAIGGATGGDPDEIEWGERKRGGLMTGVVDLATCVVQPLPGLSAQFGRTPSSKEAIVRIEQKLARRRLPAVASRDPASGSSIALDYRDQLAAQAAAQSGARRGSAPLPGTTAAWQARVDSSPRTARVSTPGAEVPAIDFASEFEVAAPAAVGEPLDEAWDLPVLGHRRGSLINIEGVHDDRIRARVTAAMLAHCSACDVDPQAALRHLWTAFEAAMIDFAGAHRDAFGLAGDPAGWTLAMLLPELFRARRTSGDG